MRIRTCLFLIVVLGFDFAALASSEDEFVLLGLLGSSGFGLIVPGSIAKGRARPFGLGAILFGALALGVSLNPWAYQETQAMLPTQAIFDRAFLLIHPECRHWPPPHLVIPSPFGYPDDFPENPLTERGPQRYVIGSVILSQGAALLGGLLFTLLAARSRRGPQSAPSVLAGRDSRSSEGLS